MYFVGKCMTFSKMFSNYKGKDVYNGVIDIHEHTFLWCLSKVQGFDF